jgi:hypothetical protein
MAGPRVVSRPVRASIFDVGVIAETAKRQTVGVRGPDGSSSPKFSGCRLCDSISRHDQYEGQVHES